MLGLCIVAPGRIFETEVFVELKKEDRMDGQMLMRTCKTLALSCSGWMAMMMMTMLVLLMPLLLVQ